MVLAGSWTTDRGVLLQSRFVSLDLRLSFLWRSRFSCFLSLRFSCVQMRFVAARAQTVGDAQLEAQGRARHGMAYAFRVWTGEKIALRFSLSLSFSFPFSLFFFFSFRSLFFRRLRASESELSLSLRWQQVESIIVNRRRE